MSSSSYICHGVGPLVDPFRSHVSRSLFKGLPWFLLPVGEQRFITLGNLLRGILFTCCIQFLLYSSNLSKIGVIFNSFATCAFSFIDSKDEQIPGAKSSWQVTMLDHQYSELFKSPFWRLEFWGGSYIFSKLAHLWCTAYTILLETETEMKPHQHYLRFQLHTVPTSLFCITRHYSKRLHLVVTTTKKLDTKIWKT